MQPIQDKDERITIRIQTKTKQNLNSLAEQNHLCLSEYIRKKIEGKAIVTKVPPINWNVYAELLKVKVEINRVGNNINQIAKAINTEKMLGKPLPRSLNDPKALTETQDLLEKTTELLSRIRLELIGIKDDDR
jgi:hypothetical protein